MSNTIAVKERPLLMCGEMVRAVLENRKTQTRRVVNPQPKHWLIQAVAGLTHGYDGSDDGALWYDADGIAPGRPVRCPYGEVGDRLWVRETWAEKAWNDEECRRAGCPDARRSREVYLGENLRAIYRASYDVSLGDCGPWKPSIFMPRWASRITLELTDVRVQRVQDISPADCRAEGEPAENNDAGVRYGYGQLWNRLNEKRGYGWDVSPWVWVLEFKKV